MIRLVEFMTMMILLKDQKIARSNNAGFDKLLHSKEYKISPTEIKTP